MLYVNPTNLVKTYNRNLMKHTLLALAAGLFLLQQGASAQSTLTQNKLTAPKGGATPNGPSKSVNSISSPHEICGTMQYTKWREAQDPTYMAQLEKAAKVVADYAKAHPSASERTTGLITLPVVVHVVYHTATEQISSSAVTSQITVLNEDFTRTNPDAGSTPSAFTSVAANLGINFCLATKDPNGNPTTGIVYTSTTVTGFTTNDNVKFTTKGGDDQWDPTKYLNIWVCNLYDNSGGVIGYGEFPTSPLDNTFGVVCDYRTFGTIGAYLFTGYTGGRTMTHEFSHCFNLHHVWGDDGGLCPWSGGADDGEADTPPQADATFGCPGFPTTDACTGSSPGIMFMNFMDYTYDNCKNLFTNDQKTTVINALNSLMPSLLTSNVCSATAPPVADFKASAITIPQWAYTNFTDLSTQSPNAWAWTFTSALTPTSSVQNPTNISWSSPGYYTCSLKATNGFGNNTATKTNYIHVISGQACDTITNLHATDTLTYYESQNSSGNFNGYVLGTNTYNAFKDVAEYFSDYPTPGFYVTGVYIYFIRAYSKTGKNITVDIWDNTGAGGSPGTVLGSKTIAINSIDTSKPYLVTFTSPISISTPFYAGVDYSTIYSSTTDTIAIVSNIDGESVPGTTWQYFNPGSGYAWSSVYSIWGINISSAIYPVMCTSPTALAQYDLSSGIKLYPNPSSGKITTEFSLDYTSADINVDVFNMLGQNVEEQHWSNVSNGTYHLDLSNQPNGLYFVKFISDHATITKKVMIER